VPNSITARLDMSRADLVLNSLADVSMAELLERVSESA
jgi:ribosomal protein L12E/L44/L45/RPP1/RPP2